MSVPLLLGLVIAAFRPIPAIERPPALLVHSGLLVFGVLLNLLAFFFSALRGWG